MNQEIVIPVCDLKAALPGLSKIVSKRCSLPVLQAVPVARDAEGKVSLMATDLDAFATYTVKEPQSGPAVEILMPLDQLTKTAKGMKPEGRITLIPDGKEKVKLWYSIAGNQVRQTVNALPPDEFPPVPKVNQPSMPLEPGFGLALRQALECCSEDSSRYILKGACLDVRESKLHYVVGTNGRCLFSANSFCFDLKKSVVIPDSKFLEWPDLMDDEEPASLSVEPGEEAQPAKDGKPAQDGTAGWVKLESGRWTFITKEIYGEFPNWKQVLPETSSTWTRINLSDEAMKQLLLVTPNLPGGDGLNQPVRLRITTHYLNVEGRNKDDEDWTSIPVDASVMGKPVTVALNRSYLLNALRFGLNELEIEDRLEPSGVFQGRQEDGHHAGQSRRTRKGHHTRPTQFRSNHSNDTSNRTNRASSRTGGDNRRKDRHAQNSQSNHTGTHDHVPTRRNPRQQQRQGERQWEWFGHQITGRSRGTDQGEPQKRDPRPDHRG